MAEDNVALARFMEELRHHLKGWQNKVNTDFAKANFDKEINGLSVDPVYAKFHLATPDYVFIRLMGRMSVSIGRRLGEIYDKIPRFAAQGRYNLTRDQVVTKLGGLEIDIRLLFSDLDKLDQTHLQKVAKDHLKIDHSGYKGLGIEIRYNFNPNDSSRLRKDKQLAGLLIDEGLYPVYLVFADNSPRLEDAVTSLERAGWNFLIARPALDFMAEVVGFDISIVLEKEAVSDEIKKETELFMHGIWSSYAASQLTRLD
jgi:hypothetical protein